MQHSLVHSLIAGRSMVVGHVLTEPHVFFYVHQSHRHYSTHPCLFMSWGALWKPLVCSYDIRLSRTWQVSITSLAATSVSQMITHPSTNPAQSCLTSVIRITCLITINYIRWLQFKLNFTNLPNFSVSCPLITRYIL